MFGAHRVTVLLLCAGFASACAHVVEIPRIQPGYLNLSTSRQIALAVEVPAGTNQGPAEALSVILNVTQGQFLPVNGAVEPLRNELRKQLQQTRFTLADPQAANTLIRVMPTEWTWRGPLPFQGGTGQGRLDARIEVFDGSNARAPLIYDDSYWANVEAGNEAEALLLAARLLVGAFTDTLQPRRVWSRVELDDTDPVGKTGLELCDKGRFEAAHEAFSDVLARYPNSAPTLYNLAVLEEAQGNYAQAEAHLTAATRIQQKALYYEALERVRASKAAHQALSNPI